MGDELLEMYRIQFWLSGMLFLILTLKKLSLINEFIIYSLLAKLNSFNNLKNSFSLTKLDFTWMNLLTFFSFYLFLQRYNKNFQFFKLFSNIFLTYLCSF